MYKIYQVEYGDTLDTVAQKTNTTKDDIKNINGINGEENLVVGSLIIVPKDTNEVFKKYKVKAGDSFYSIANMFNVDLDTLLLINGLSKTDYIYPNQEIILPKENIDVYVTKKGDTIYTVLNKLGTDLNTLNKENDKLYLVEDQLVIHKKD